MKEYKNKSISWPGEELRDLGQSHLSTEKGDNGGWIAQSVAHWNSNPRVPGSSPGIAEHFFSLWHFVPNLAPKTLGLLFCCSTDWAIWPPLSHYKDVLVYCMFCSNMLDIYNIVRAVSIIQPTWQSNFHNTV